VSELAWPDTEEIRLRWFTPIQLLELDACTRCQECVDACPVVRAGYPDGAMERIAGLRRLGTREARLLSHLHRNPSFEEEQAALFSSLFRCTSCGACAVVCESGIATTPLWESIMGAARELEFKDATFERTARMIVDTKSPYGNNRQDRATWIPAEIPVVDSAPVGFFPGCTAAFRQPEIGQAALRILAKSGIPFCMLREKESCCGSFLFRTGSWMDYREIILVMIEDLEKRGVKTLLVSCAGCLKTITVDWPRVYGQELPFTTLPFAAFIRDLIRKKKVRFTAPVSLKVVYHDPCHLGRHLMHHLGRDLVFEAPRDVLHALPGLDIVEFEQNREWQVCCGAGGGIKARDPDLALTIAREKVSTVNRFHADILASTCPFCRRNFEDVRADTGSSFEVLDIIQLADRMIE